MRCSCRSHVAPKPPQRAVSGPKLIQKPELTACDLAALQEQREINLKNGKTTKQPKSYIKEMHKGLGDCPRVPLTTRGLSVPLSLSVWRLPHGNTQSGFFLGSLVQLLHSWRRPVAQRITARADPYFHPKIQTS